MKILKYISIVMVGLAAIYFLVAALAPRTFNVQRKIVIQASPETIFKHVNSFKNWEHWSPWLKADSTIKNIYSGPEAGVGCKTSWTSKKSGAGSMEIIESVDGRFIRNSLMFNDFTPFEAHFTFTAKDSGTEVSWSDSGSMKFPMNIFTLFADKMMGPDFEHGLKNLKEYVEALPKWKLGEYKTGEQPAQHILAVMDSCSAAEIGKKLGALYGEIGQVMRKNKLDFAGAPMAYYYSFTPDKVVLEAAVAVAKEIKGEGRVKGRTTAATKALSVSFFGDYSDMSSAMQVITNYMKQNKLEPNGPECDIYITDPTTVKDKMQIETKIVFPVK